MCVYIYVTCEQTRNKIYKKTNMRWKKYPHFKYAISLAFWFQHSVPGAWNN